MGTDFINIHRCNGSISGNAQSLGTVSTVLYAREVVEDDFDSSDDFEIEDMDEQDEHGQM